ncbi:PQQ-binding-like beta-propeller repeat protein [Aggregicoccus sp. 17bor-14]|uniref:PQQ-binding-like beta-propeller repeat protein n=1 Tax=Myxococcaceae TaxID=31 RepID=UPI00129CA2C6|nr:MULTISPECIES: PQQ-binding-like beta-propeller repeat protein [Myxococcaceae]MBF5043303.1 PQQ-binding-like beta-propeller repeat protein [Simulacricoccus sp. 17bor-14]MRI89062.1 PQQ-binding-like beta-propeller repeat protein [Aggregicoccus sp. 17bor-14]
MSRLELESHLTPGHLADLGKPSGVFPHPGGEWVALASDFPLLYWPGRATYEGHRLRHRISLYDGSLRVRVAVLDTVRFPINDVAFHPTRPILAIGTGRYDGGYLFEGELLLWNWETGECSNLLAGSREVVRLRFVDGERLAVLLRPVHEEEFEGDAFDTYLGTVLTDLRSAAAAGFTGPDPRLAGLTPRLPATLGFEAPAPTADLQRAEAARAFCASRGLEARTRVWDLSWTPEGRLAAVHDGCLAELWEAGGTRLECFTGAGHGVQLARVSDHLVVHVVHRATDPFAAPDRSSLHRLQDRELVHVRDFPHTVALGADAAGRLLCRDTGDLMRRRPREDLVLATDGTELLRGDLGHYDLFNHFVRLDGGEGLCFLRGTPPSSHQGKRLCRIGRDGTVQALMAWDGLPRHAMNAAACWGPADSLLRAFQVYDPRPSAATFRLERCDPVTGQVLWTRELEALVTAMTPVGTQGHVAYALTSGDVGLVDAETGALVWQESARINGVATVLLSLAARGEQLAAGAIDGRLLLYRYTS